MTILEAWKKTLGRTGRCPSTDQLAAYIDGKLNEVERSGIERHLADCRDCLSLVAGAISDINAAATATPTWLRQRAESLGGGRESRSRRWAWALVPALACLLAVAVVVRRPTKHVTESLTPAPMTFPSPATGGTAGESTRSGNRQQEAAQLLVPSKGAVIKRSELRFEWKAVPNASSYWIRITTIEGGLVWESRSEQPHAQPPKTVRLDGKDYFVWVTAYLDDGQALHLDPVQFRVRP